MSESALDLARRIVVANAYLTLATADADGRPWATPVWFAAADLKEFIWASKPGARHSRNIGVRAEVGIVVFDSTIDTEHAAAVYIEATAAEVADSGRESALAVYNARAAAVGLPTWTEVQVMGAARHRLYRAEATQAYVLDEHDERIPFG